MAYLPEKLKLRYGNLPEGSYSLGFRQDIGYILEWNHPSPEPSLGDIDAQYTDEEALASRPGRETAVTKNPNTDAILRLIARLTNTPYATVVSELKKLLV
jgi:hypothetical protein